MSVHAGSNRSSKPLPYPFDRHSLQQILQCQRCFQFLQDPVTMKCGNSFCRECVEIEQCCPIDQCWEGEEPRLMDVTLSGLLEAVAVIMKWAQSYLGGADVIPNSRLEQEIYDRLSKTVLQKEQRKQREESADIPEAQSPIDLPMVGSGIRELAEKSRPPLPHTVSLDDSKDEKLDRWDLAYLVRAGMSEDRFCCLTCLAACLEPMTLACGHTFCRECLHHQIDRSSVDAQNRKKDANCPMCFRSIPWSLPYASALHHEHTWDWVANHSIASLIDVCWVPELDERKEAWFQDERVVPAGYDTPLFVCTTGIPTQPTTLSIFEPKYRAMLRRVLRTPERTFGMVPPRNDSIRPHQSIGTLLRVENVVYTQPRHITVFTKCVGRFQIIDSTNQHSGSYWCAATAPYGDHSASEERELERSQVGFMRALDPTLRRTGFDVGRINLDWLGRAVSQAPAVISRLTKRELLDLLRAYLDFSRSEMRVLHGSDSRWLNYICADRGEPPEDDPDALSWWCTGYFMKHSAERYMLVKKRSTRERLLAVVLVLGKIWAEYARQGLNNGAQRPGESLAETRIRYGLPPYPEEEAEANHGMEEDDADRTAEEDSEPEGR